jgi:hypothetical protein
VLGCNSFCTTGLTAGEPVRIASSRLSSTAGHVCSSGEPCVILPKSTETNDSTGLSVDMQVILSRGSAHHGGPPWMVCQASKGATGRSSTMRITPTGVGSLSTVFRISSQRWYLLV